MSKPVRSRRLIALFASYVVALQALLLPLTVVGFAAPGAAICESAAGEGSHQPASHDSGCACVAGCGMQCCAQALAAPPRPEIALRPTRANVIAPPSSLREIAQHTERGPHSQRAPPSA